VKEIIAVRTVVLSMSISADGYIARPNGELDWIFPNIDADLRGWILDSLREMDTHLIGRVNYLEQAQYWPTADDEMADIINAVEKVVFSRTLDQVDWHNSRLADGDVADVVTELKQREGKGIWVAGGASLAQTLSGLGLIDVYRLIVHPVALGSGLRLFADPVDLKLVSSRSFATGVVANVYERV
jgi:dihydrofolate reductase